MPIRMAGLVSNLDTDSIIKELMSAQRMKQTKIKNKKTKAEWTQEIWKKLNTKLYSFYTGTLSSMKMQKTFNTRSATSADTSKVTAKASISATTGTHQIKISQLASAQFVTGSALDSSVTSKTTLSSLGVGAGDITITNGSKTKTLTIDSSTNINDLTTAFKDAGINASFDSTQKRLYITSKESGSDNAFSLSADSTVDLSRVGLSTFSAADPTGTVSLSGGGTMSLVAAQNAEFEYNGAAMTSSSNSVSVNGITMNFLATTGTDTVNINVENDTDAVYDSIKSYIKEYNDLLKTMNEYYYASTAKGYDPLTDDEKEAMTDDQVEQWETKIKDSLLRRDDTISSLLSVMRTSMSGSVEYDGKGYTLASFGVKTSKDYTEKGLLHISGDADDSSISSEDNDLMSALSENPDAVMATFNKFAGDLYSTFSDKMKTSSLSSALTFYNDKEIKKNIKDYEDDIDDMEDKLTDMENRYYKQFTAMETALSKLNSQSSYLTSLLGSSS